MSDKTEKADSGKIPKPPASAQPTKSQVKWLTRGLTQAGGKLPLFDSNGQRVSERTVKSCIARGWAEPWFDNPIKPDWVICKLTDSGRHVVEERI